MNYTEFAALPRSQKVTLAVIKAKQRLKNFEDQGGDTWTRTMPFYVSNVIGAAYSYDPITSTLTLTSIANPNTLNIIAEYSFFFSDFPVNHDVEYQPRLTDIGALKLELDTENTGIALESDSSIKLENTDGYFDEIFDTLTWENQKCEFYSWSPLIPWSERRLIYRGYINTKAFSDKVVTFTIKDTFFRLREKIPFTGSRLIYGKAKNVDCSALDTVGQGFALAGTLSGRNDRDLLSGVVSGTATSNTITGVGTFFTTQLAVSDKIRVIDGLVEYTYTISAIGSNTSLTISGTISTTFSGATGRNAAVSNNIIIGVGTSFLDGVSPGDKIKVLDIEYTVGSVDTDLQLTTSEQVKEAFISETATNLPEINYRMKNRHWNVSGHVLADCFTSIATVYSQRVFSVIDRQHIETGDTVEINGNIYTISRVSGNLITINQTALVAITAGNEVRKMAVQKVTIAGVEFVPDRDYVEGNIDYECSISFNEMAEFNVATEVVSGVSFTFTVGSRIVTSLSSSLDLTGIYAPRDWIKPFSGSVSTWYEILEVKQLSLVLRETYSEVRNYTGPALYKKPAYIGDDSIVLVDCMGKRATTVNGGEWLGTASDAVKDICTYLGIDDIDQAGFAQAKIDCPYCLSFVYPESLSGAMPIARDMISEINKSVFGSLHANNNFEISYSILNADRDEVFEMITDSDIYSFTTTSKNQIIKTVNATFRKEAGAGSALSYTFSNENISGINTEIEINLGLYNQSDAETTTQRFAFLRSGTQTIVNIKGPLSLAGKALNSRVYLRLDRLFKRFGSSGKIKIGLVNLVSKDSSQTEISVNDLGNIFNRVGSIAPNDSVDFATATDEEKSIYAYIVDNDNETPNALSDEALGANLIG